MKFTIIKLVFVLCFFSLSALAKEIIIQENDPGFCNLDGSVQTSVTGYTGDGYADPDRGVGVSISWSVYAPTEGYYKIWWNYANGGGSGDRPARLIINSEVYMDTLNFAHTGEWTNWTNSDTVEAYFNSGSNQIRIEGYSPDGLGNYDYFVASGVGIEPGECKPFYTVEVNVNDSEAGTVIIEPVRDYYEEGSTITLTAIPNPGYFFQSWTGNITSDEQMYAFQLKNNIDVTARFLPDGAVQDAELVGYATVQDDTGTPYLVTGGSLGQTVVANSLDELKSYLGSNEHLVVTLDHLIEADDEITVGSNKTLLGIGNNAHLKGVELQINGARNVIIRNLKISHITPEDAVEINGKSQNIWIDHCDLFSDRDHGTDYYDGLLDIKNESSFITISWTKFHDHYKTSLIASGDDSIQDSVIRVTYHHNYFYNCESRLPSIRFGKAHVFNNYYKDCGTAINSRMGACVRVERNYFDNVGTAVMMRYSPEVGSVQLIDNHFGTSNYSTSPECILNIPYEYESHLDETEQIPNIITSELVTSVNDQSSLPAEFSLSQNYPNPFNPTTTIKYSIPKSASPLSEGPGGGLKAPTSRGDFAKVRLVIYDMLGREVAILVNEFQNSGNHQVEFDAGTLASGIYFYRLIIKGNSKNYGDIKKIILIK